MGQGTPECWAVSPSPPFHARCIPNPDHHNVPRPDRAPWGSSSSAPQARQGRPALLPSWPLLPGGNRCSLTLGYICPSSARTPQPRPWARLAAASLFWLTEDTKVGNARPHPLPSASVVTRTEPGSQELSGVGDPLQGTAQPADWAPFPWLLDQLRRRPRFSEKLAPHRCCRCNKNQAPLSPGRPSPSQVPGCRENSAPLGSPALPTPTSVTVQTNTTQQPGQ